MTPELKIYNIIRKTCADLYGEHNVYTQLPGEVPYPFIYIGDQFSQNVRIYKSGISKNTQIVVHVWHDNMNERGVVAQMLGEIGEAVTDALSVRGENQTTQIITDSSTKVNLLHGILDIDIKV